MNVGNECDSSLAADHSLLSATKMRPNLVAPPIGRLGTRPAFTKAWRLAPSATADNQAFALHPLASEFPGPANRFGFLSRALLRGLFVKIAKLHLPEDAFPMHLLLKSFQRMVDVDDTNMNLHTVSCGLC
jgi:hypothetical protein